MEGQRGSSRKGFESIARHRTLIYALSNIYKVKLTKCTIGTEKEWIY